MINQFDLMMFISINVQNNIKFRLVKTGFSIFRVLKICFCGLEKTLNVVLCYGINVFPVLLCIEIG